jgi:hypothetical protein
MIRLKSFLYHIIILSLILLFIAGCKPIEPTYTKENFAFSIKKICKEEYGIDDVQVWLTGETVWIYTPQDKLLDKNQEFDKEILERINKVALSVSRVLLSLKPRPKFYVIVASDIKDVGADLLSLGYVDDIVRFQFQDISRGEFGRRNVYEAVLNPLALSDIKGEHVIPYDVKMQDFLALQIAQRINFKFKENNFKVESIECVFENDTFNLKYKIEKDKNASSTPPLDNASKITGDVDKEITNIIAKVLKAYNFRDYSWIEINNLLSGRKLIFSRAAFDEIIEGLKN